MAAIDYPNSPTVGQQFTVGNVTWIWDGAKWGVPTTGGSSLYLPLSGGVMSGPITLKGDPVAPLQPVTYRMISNPNDNRIINGDMRINQRGAPGTVSGYTVDRWVFAGIPADKGIWSQASAGPALVSVGFGYCFSFVSSSAYTLAAGDCFILYQSIEADMVSDFAWGTPNAQPVTLSFWVQCTKTGTFSGAIQNFVGDRSYPFTYSIPTANVWLKIIVTIPGDTGGTWVMSGNAGSVVPVFDMGSGTTLRAPANAWVNGGYYGVTGAQSIVATNAANWLVTGVKLEIGSVATPFNRQSLAKSMADCQRYYATGQLIGGGSMTATGIMYAPYSLPVTMRASPTLVITTDTSTNLASKSLNVAYGPRDLYAQGTATTTTQCNFNLVFTASAEL